MKIWSTLAMSLAVVSLSAAPALKIKKLVSLADGTKIEVMLCGDEAYSYYVTDDGFLVEPDTNGAFYVKTNRRATEAVRANRPGMAPRHIGSQSTAAIRAIGSPRIPVILVNFSDSKFTVADTDEAVAAYYERYCNGTGTGVNYTGAGSTGAIKDYFVAQSDSLFQPEFTIIGPVTLSKSVTYYGANSGSQKDVNYAAFRTEAIQAAMTEGGINWTDFDNDGNGSVDMVYFIYAGLGENVGGGEHTLWPKESTAQTVINGITFANSACCNEAHPDQRDADGQIVSTKPSGIGVMCHELSHALGLPDFYDTRGVAFGMDMWSLMDYGCYCGNGYNPVGYTAYERDFMGWRQLRVLDEPATVRLTALEAGGHGYKISSESNANEYYILENRNDYGWDATLARRCGHGMLVQHVDYSASAWTSNTVNTNTTHQRMTIVPANNSFIGSTNYTSGTEYFASLAGNPYPGTSGNTSLTDESAPAATLFTGGYLGKPLMDIREDEGVVTFKFRPQGTLSAPDVLSAGDVEADPYRFTAKWLPVAHADAYALEVYSRLAEDVYELLFRLDSLSGTSKVISGMEPGVTYAYRVQALADAYLDSPFSDYRVVSTLVDGIDAASASSAQQPVAVYSLQGVLLERCSEKDLRARLQPGVYVVKPRSGQSYKVVIEHK